ncbi:hypothetical protein ACTXT7_004445 [Hymenolepis weldensis]
MREASEDTLRTFKNAENDTPNVSSNNTNKHYIKRRSILCILLRHPSPTHFESESDCKLPSDQVVFIDDVFRSSGYCFHQIGGFGVMRMLIYSPFNHVPPSPAPPPPTTHPPTRHPPSPTRNKPKD